jgi:hypothetical protein
MRRLSSFWTPFSKRIVPTVLLGGMAVGAISAALAGKPLADVLIGFCFAAAFVLVLQRILASDLADDVVDIGDSLIIKRGRLKDRIPLANLLKVETSVAVNPPRMTLYFVAATAFGKSVPFSPISSRSLNPFSNHPLVEELMDRAQKARTKNAA